MQELLFLGRQPVNARGKYGLNRSRHLGALDLFLQMIIASLSHQNFCLHQGSDALFEEKRVPLCSFDQKLFEGLKSVVIAQN